jgi:homoserine kinase
MKNVIVRVPASTSNLGPGFDCLGIALRIYNTVVVRREARNNSRSNMVDEAARSLFKQIGARPFEFSVAINGDVPQARGLGSSVTVRLGVLHGLNELCRRPCDRLSIFRLCAELEDHPDNAAPASFGGFTVVQGESLQRFTISARLSFVLLVPDYEVATSQARRALPAKLDRTLAVESCGNACAITAAFASRNYKALRGAFVDHLHQPFRRKLNPAMSRAIEAAEDAGALGAFLSGSGSTVCAVTLKNADGIAAAMKRAAKSPAARTIITTADNRGVTVQIRNPKSGIRNSRHGRTR